MCDAESKLYRNECGFNTVDEDDPLLADYLGIKTAWVQATSHRSRDKLMIMFGPLKCYNSEDIINGPRGYRILEKFLPYVLKIKGIKKVSNKWQNKEWTECLKLTSDEQYEKFTGKPREVEKPIGDEILNTYVIPVRFDV